MTWTAFLIVYVVGGLTFIPFLLAIGLLHAYLTLPTHDGTPNPNENDSTAAEHSPGERQDALSTTGLEKLPDELKPRTHEPDVAAGYFAVCREYVPGGINGKPPERTTPAGAVVAAESPSVYQSMYRSIFERNKTLAPSFDGANGKNLKARNVFYVVLRHGHLMLYDDSEQLEVRHVISLAHYEIDLYAGGDPIPEGELWIKRNCIRLAQRLSQHDTITDPKPFFFFSENCSEKEDFYHALLQNHERSDAMPDMPPKPLLFDTPDLVKLVQQLHASEETLQTRWINALIGRLFLSMYKTQEVENFIRAKITKKISRVPTPAFISNIRLQKIDMGHLPPSITNPKLRELTVDGDLTLEADVRYKGEFRLEISAIVRIALGSRFKPREVTIILAGILKNLEGHILLRMKPPPSNRLWVTFETPPKMDLSIEPIVSSRQITYGVILRAIESRIRETVSETLVLPNWDDIPFSDTSNQRIRGGIWARGSKDSDTPPLEDERASGLPGEEQEREQEFESDELDVLPSTTILPQDTNQSMPNLDAPTITARRSTGAMLPEEGSKSTGFTSAVDFTTTAKPKAMRSGSFASKADPILNNSALAEATKGEPQPHQDAASAIRTIAKSHPASPAGTPIGSPTKSDLTTHPSAPLDAASDLLLSEAVADVETSSFESTPQLAQSRSLPRNAFGTQKRPLINQSLNTATAAAKKWFASRQTQENAIKPTGTDGVSSDTSNAHASSTGNNPSPLGSPAHPIGRGQPLPPPGTPLPLPARIEKRNWSVPSAATFANFTRRKPVPGKDLQTSEEETLNQPSDVPELSGAGEGVPGNSRRKSSAASGPPPLPPRRQRKSITEPTMLASGADLLVVEAPLDGSAPTSPMEDRRFEEDEGSGRNTLSNGPPLQGPDAPSTTIDDRSS